MSAALALFTLFPVALSVVGILAGFVVVFELITAISGDYRSAFRVTAQFEAAQVFPRGLGIDWSTYRGDRETVILQSILKDTGNPLSDAGR